MWVDVCVLLTTIQIKIYRSFIICTEKEKYLTSVANSLNIFRKRMKNDSRGF